MIQASSLYEYTIGGAPTQMLMQKMSGQHKVEKSARNEANLKISEQSKSELLSNYVRNGTKPQAHRNTPGNLEINRNKLNLGPL